MLNIIKTVGVLLFIDNKVLLVRHGEMAEHLNNTYGVPAGRIEPGESSIETAVRELFEETGLKTTFENLTQIPKIYTATIERKTGINTFHLETFLCNNWSGKLRATDETIPEWINLDKLNHLNLLLNIKQIVADGLKLI
ncbi:MAG: NUDIX domain-containing protein [Patescibacteria group bacterium]